MPTADDTPPRAFLSHGHDSSGGALQRPDVFISIPDSARTSDAARLAEQLDHKGYSAYRSSAGQYAGRSPRKVPDLVFLRQAGLLVVLLSRESAGSAIQKDAVERAREAGIPILPVEVESLAAPRPFGLDAGDGIRVGSMDWGQVAERIVDRIQNDRSVSARPAAPSPPMHRSYGDVFHRAALRVDRKDQWEPVVRFCRGEDSGIFLLRGERKQNLEFFMWRVMRYLVEESGRHHAFHVIRVRDEHHSVPRSVAAWEHKLRIALGGREGTAADLLREATRHNAVFLFLRKRPFAYGELEAPELEALEGFLSGRLPEMVTAAAGSHPVRMLLAAHYDEQKGRERELEDRFDSALRTGCDGRLEYKRLPPLARVSWEHVEAYLDDDVRPRPSKDFYRKVRAAYDELSRRDHSFEELTQMLDAMLDD